MIQWAETQPPGIFTSLRREIDGTMTMVRFGSMRTILKLGAALLVLGLATPVMAQQQAPDPAPSAAADSQPPAAPAKRNAWASPLEVISKGVKLRSDPVESADFVKASRPAELNYIPVGSARPEPASRVLNLDELRAKQAELEALQSRHDKIAGRKQAKVAYNPIAQEPKKKAPKPVVTCTITCQVRLTTSREH